jgi:molybdopterin-containing oxidoreductase family iron-sulfur binding subunit
MDLIQINTDDPNSSGKRLELKDVQEKLGAARGPQYWRSLEELANTPEFEEMLHREFPRQASEWVGDDVSRRGFLKLMSASLALAGLSGCTKMPTQAIVPYVRQPEELVPGRPMFYATAATLGAYGLPLLVRSYEGRPTKIEGNPEHPVSRGASDIYSQGLLLQLYDPDRLQSNEYLGQIRSWPSFIGAMQGPMATQKASGGAGLRILTPTISSPTMAAQLRTLQQKFPKMKWHQWEPVNRDGAFQGAQMAFGQPVEARYQLQNADVIVTLDADFLFNGYPGFTMYASDWASRREPAGSKPMSRMYAIESVPTSTGFKADHRISVRPSEVEQYARALATQLGVGAGGNVRSEHQQMLTAIAKELQAHRGTAVVIPGEDQPGVVHALAHAINEAIGAVGSTVVYTDPIAGNWVNESASLKELVSDINAGKVEFLLMLGGNPVYTSPVDSDFASILSRVPLKIYQGMYSNETAVACDWVVAGTHFLEEWSDARAANGAVSIVQPLISPLYGGHSAHEILTVLNGQPDVSSYDLVRAFWQTQFHGVDFEAFWRRAVHDGVIAGTEFTPKTLQARRDFGTATPVVQGYELTIRRDPHIYDGRFANNGWLQELPKPLTKLTWDAPAWVSPNTAKKLGIKAGQDADVIQLEHRGRKIDVAVWVQAGQPDDVVTMFFGYGRLRAGQTGTGRGSNAYSMWFSDEPYYAGDLKPTKTGETYLLASTQGYQNIDGQNQIRAATLATYKEDPNFAHSVTEAPKKEETLFPPFEYPTYAWGMTIDMNSCVGCNACMIACQAENNIPVVGKEQTLRGRHMHWIRIDGYYQGDPSNPRMYFQPLPCMQCENAPCELVCPVGATVHSSEGLNDMVYNRCVGTRYCSNNCPYKVRRFNFMLFQDWDSPQYKMMRNPDVSVRSRGVMEKCTYCVQRITQGRIRAEEQDRRVADGEILTACQQACPTSAIVFGDINDPKSRVAQLKKNQRDYGVLEEINTRPRTTYLAAVLNPNPELPETQPEQNL